MAKIELLLKFELRCTRTHLLTNLNSKNILNFLNGKYLTFGFMLFLVVEKAPKLCVKKEKDRRVFGGKDDSTLGPWIYDCLVKLFSKKGIWCSLNLKQTHCMSFFIATKTSQQLGCKMQQKGCWC